jgi:hypothetical protein
MMLQWIWSSAELLLFIVIVIIIIIVMLVFKIGFPLCVAWWLHIHNCPISRPWGGT